MIYFSDIMQEIESPIINSEEVESRFETDNPTVFIDRFKTSNLQKKAYDKFFEGKNLNPAVTDAMKDRVFYESKNATDALVDYYVATNEYTFNPDEYSTEAINALNEYNNFVSAIRQNPARDRDGILDNDRKRSAFHLAAAQALVTDGIVPSIRMGRMLARIVLVENGIESLDEARAMR